MSASTEVNDLGYITASVDSGGSADFEFSVGAGLDFETFDEALQYILDTDRTMIATLRLAPGTHTMNDSFSLLFPANVSIVGDGRDRTTLQTYRGLQYLKENELPGGAEGVSVIRDIRLHKLWTAETQNPERAIVRVMGRYSIELQRVLLTYDADNGLAVRKLVNYGPSVMRVRDVLYDNPATVTSDTGFTRGVYVTHNTTDYPDERPTFDAVGFRPARHQSLRAAIYYETPYELRVVESAIGSVVAIQGAGGVAAPECRLVLHNSDIKAQAGGRPAVTVRGGVTAQIVNCFIDATAATTAAIDVPSGTPLTLINSHAIGLTNVVSDTVTGGTQLTAAP